MNGFGEFTIDVKLRDLTNELKAYGEKQTIAGMTYEVRLRLRKDGLAVAVYLPTTRRFVLYHGYYDITCTVEDDETDKEEQKKLFTRSSYFVNIANTDNRDYTFLFDRINTASDEICVNVQVHVKEFYLRDLRESQDEADDKKIILDDNTSFFVSRSLFSLQSPFFAAAFRNSDNCKLNVTSKSSFNLLLHFFYGVDVNTDALAVNDVKDLLQLVERFQCTTPKIGIERSLLHNCPVRYQECLQEIDRCGMHQLVRKVVETCTKDDFKEMNEGVGIMEKFSKATCNVIFEKMMTMMPGH
ncbi:hypothetical protein QR680_007530 [Steinernema hermaphroditum]|uniref:BTB domain-containing protein n=1 Tax=Steinernema hermaphroditum TaxID=289476 RepID=A0AA39IEV8_9BILA|nr:hypothetical protein QR680_007530 [Steinernema hermaphroditum]